MLYLYVFETMYEVSGLWGEFIERKSAEKRTTKTSKLLLPFNISEMGGERIPSAARHTLKLFCLIF